MLKAVSEGVLERVTRRVRGYQKGRIADVNGCIADVLRRWMHGCMYVRMYVCLNVWGY